MPAQRGYDVMVACQLPKLNARVRFPLPAPAPDRNRQRWARASAGSRASGMPPGPTRFRYVFDHPCLGPLKGASAPAVCQRVTGPLAPAGRRTSGPWRAGARSSSASRRLPAALVARTGGGRSAWPVAAAARTGNSGRTACASTGRRGECLELSCRWPGQDARSGWWPAAAVEGCSDKARRPGAGWTPEPPALRRRDRG